MSQTEKSKVTDASSVASAEAFGEMTTDSSTPSSANQQLVNKRRLVDRNNMKAVYAAKSPVYKGLKRFFDIVLSGGALIVLTPIFAATAIAIIAEDGRPVIYAAKRPGRNMKPFPMYKFRSMFKDADARLKDLLKDNEQTGAAFKIKALSQQMVDFDEK